MAQDLRDLLKANEISSTEKMSEGHETRFLEKLDKALPQKQQSSVFGIWKIAASVVILLGLSYAVFQMGSEAALKEPVPEQTAPAYATLGDVSPELKKVEDFYLASINMQLAQVKLTADNKDLFDGYLIKLEELNTEYQKLNVELNENGPNTLTIEALISNLKLRLNLLMRLQEQIKALEAPSKEAATL